MRIMIVVKKMYHCGKKTNKRHTKACRRYPSVFAACRGFFLGLDWFARARRRLAAIATEKCSDENFLLECPVSVQVSVQLILVCVSLNYSCDCKTHNAPRKEHSVVY
jgi:hypothetical protein